MKPEKYEFHRIAVFRHDVDAIKQNTLAFSKIQYSLGTVGTYYFRVVPQSYNESVIKQIASMGHEIGYHYETMDTCKGNIDNAYDEFCRNLEIFRKIVPIETICMHGSPLSKYDNRAIWDKYDYKKLGIIGEPYFDLDFNKTFYLTDTGRRWDGDKYSVRDKPLRSSKDEGQRKKEELTWPRYHSTFDIIKALEAGTFPKKVMMTFHPQRWHNNFYDWSKELILQNTKNIIKRILYVKN
ncbi:MAG: hypothetical protein M0Q38_01805 [Bacteroidales bacterium]|jgi:hypothetical protein|nr:hypothetical protein [Bacteroidales bacterium]